MMNLLLSVFVFLTLQFLTGCAVKQGFVPLRTERSPMELETIAYNWEGYGVEVSFHKSGTNSHWYMCVRDAWDILDQSLQRDGKTWGAADSRCSADDGLRIIDQSLARFRAIRPNARLESVHVEMQVIDDLWHDVLAGLATTMVKIDGKNDNPCREGPPELDNGVRAVLNKSPTVIELKRILRKHGLRIEYVGTSGQILFKDSLDGLGWAEIASRPDLGISLPGIVEFGLELR